MKITIRSLIVAALFFIALPISSSLAFVGVSVSIAPPALPVYEQPPCPVAGYIWTPGYWAYGPEGYYWVPGVWVPPPSIGLLWTPGYWDFNGGAYVFNNGYWGPRVGFYGGVNYGFGYTGFGYAGGEWAGNVFRYNTAVTRVNTTIIHNTYNRTVINNYGNGTGGRASFHGPGGVQRQPTAEERAAANGKHIPPTTHQRTVEQAAAKNRDLLASVNKGQPKVAAVKSVKDLAQPAEANRPGEHAARKATRAETPASNAAANQASKPNKGRDRASKTNGRVASDNSVRANNPPRGLAVARAHGGRAEAVGVRENASDHRSQTAVQRSQRTATRPVVNSGRANSNDQRARDDKKKRKHGQDNQQG